METSHPISVPAYYDVPTFLTVIRNKDAGVKIRAIVISNIIFYQIGNSRRFEIHRGNADMFHQHRNYSATGVFMDEGRYIT